MVWIYILCVASVWIVFMAMCLDCMGICMDIGSRSSARPGSTTSGLTPPRGPAQQTLGLTPSRGPFQQLLSLIPSRDPFLPSSGLTRSRGPFWQILGLT